MGEVISHLAQHGTGCVRNSVSSSRLIEKEGEGTNITPSGTHSGPERAYLMKTRRTERWEQMYLV